MMESIFGKKIGGKLLADERLFAGKRAAVFLGAALIAVSLGAFEAKALQLTPAQLKMAAQLPASERAKLAASAGLSLPGKSSPAQAALGDQNTSSAPVVTPLQKEEVSALENQFNTRLAGGGVFKKGFGSKGNDFKLRSKIQDSVSARYRSIDQKLKQFGYSLFAGNPVSFTPVSDIPIPAEYVLGPGDELYLQYYGSRSDSLSLIVDREGVIELPEVGSITVAGMNFMQAKAMLAQKIRESLIGVTASISMGRLRSMRVFVLGDARHPGSYLVSGLSTMSNALFLAGGVSKKGSLRHVLLKRNGKTLRDLDLYEFLLHGSSKNDARLLPGDVVFIPPLGKVVAVAGETVRPAIYELRRERTVADIVHLAGGFAPAADRGHVQIDRIEHQGGRTRLDVNLKQAGKKIRVRNGDLISVYRVPGLNNNMVTLFGQVKRPGDYGFNKGMKLSGLIRSRDDLLNDAYLEYALIQRTSKADRSLKMLRVSLKDLLDKHDVSADIALQDEDKVFVFAKSAIDPLESVFISGQVISAGKFPLTNGMSVTDLLLAAGGPSKQAYLKEAEITRYQIVDGQKRVVKHFQVNLSAALAGDENANVPLLPNDVLTVRQLSNWRDVEHVVLSGEIRFSGEYPIEDGEHLSALLERAGGFSDKAYLTAAVFTRESIRQDQKKKLVKMSQQLETEIARLESQSVSVADGKTMLQRQKSIASAKKMLEKMKQVKATGRLVIVLKDLKALKGSAYDLTLRDGDALYIPKRPDEVLIMGQVYNNTAMLYEKRLEVDDYIARAGGVTRLADEDHIYVVHASGIVEPVKGGWHKTRLLPGDAIVLPENLEQFNVLNSVLDWSKVFYQFGTALAAMKVIGII